MNLIDRIKLPPIGPLKTSLAQQLANFWAHLAEVCDQKQQDYGSNNLTDFGPQGVLVRANDKLQRLKTLTARRAANPQDVPLNESLLDTWADLASYAAIGFLMEARVWPEAPRGTLSGGPFEPTQAGLDNAKHLRPEEAEAHELQLMAMRRQRDEAVRQREDALARADGWHRKYRELCEKTEAVAQPVSVA